MSIIDRAMRGRKKKPAKKGDAADSIVAGQEPGTTGDEDKELTIARLYAGGYEPDAAPTVPEGAEPVESASPVEAEPPSPEPPVGASAPGVREQPAAGDTVVDGEAASGPVPASGEQPPGVDAGDAMDASPSTLDRLYEVAEKGREITAEPVTAEPVERPGDVAQVGEPFATAQDDEMPSAEAVAEAGDAADAAAEGSALPQDVYELPDTLSPESCSALPPTDDAPEEDEESGEPPERGTVSPVVDEAALPPDDEVPPRDEPPADSEVIQLDDSADVIINLRRLKSAGMVTPDAARSKIAEEFRLIKRPLLTNVIEGDYPPDEHPNLIMVTSSLPGEGKTFVAVNLAISMAMEMDRTVLLVDADVVKPSVALTLEIEPDSAGLIDMLVEPEVGLADCILSTNIPKLRLMTSGARRQNSVELLASEDMLRVANELATRYPDRIVIFDSPPLLAATEAGVLSRLMGQVVVVVEAAKTPQYILKEALTLLDESKITGLVLNKSRRPFGSEYYYYYRSSSYGYGYGTYGQ
jgi:exopolysaccharide/PEP-CTERM locus tyrosine autokinase